MSSQTDLDQGGTVRQWVLVNMGPTVGIVRVPLQNVLLIAAPGSYVINASTTLVEVNSIGVTVILPPASQPTYSGAQTTQPGSFAARPITIVDILGSASIATPVLIQPAAGETIMGLASIKIQSSYGGYTLAPNSLEKTWNSISP